MSHDTNVRNPLRYRILSYFTADSKQEKLLIEQISAGIPGQVPGGVLNSALHLPLGNTARAWLPTALAGTFQLQLARAGSSVESVVQFLAECAAGKVAVDFPLPLTMATNDNAAGHVGEIHAIIRLVHLLPALATAAHELLLQIILMHTKALHHFLELLQFFWRYRHMQRQYHVLPEEESEICTPAAFIDAAIKD